MEVKAKRVRYGQLSCVVVDTHDQPEMLVVTMHGYGAAGDDLVPLAEDWLRMWGEDGPAVRLVFPAALHSLLEMGIPGGRAWWPLNMQALLAAAELGDITELRGHEPPGLDLARTAVAEATAAALDEVGLDFSRLVIGGFSQGAMLAMDMAVRGLPQPPAGLFLYSATLICEAAWKSGAVRLANTPTIQSHGSYDQILPFVGAEALYELMKVAGVPVDFYPFEGPHTLTMQALDATAKLIRNLCDAPTDE